MKTFWQVTVSIIITVAVAFGGLGTSPAAACKANKPCNDAPGQQEHEVNDVNEAPPGWSQGEAEWKQPDPVTGVITNPGGQSGTVEVDDYTITLVNPAGITLPSQALSGNGSNGVNARQPERLTKCLALGNGRFNLIISAGNSDNMEIVTVPEWRWKVWARMPRPEARESMSRFCANAVSALN